MLHVCTVFNCLFSPLDCGSHGLSVLSFPLLVVSNLSCLCFSALARAPLMVSVAPKGSTSFRVWKLSLVWVWMARFILFITLVRCSTIVVASFLLHSLHVASHFAMKVGLSFSTTSGLIVIRIIVGVLPRLRALVRVFLWPEALSSVSKSWWYLSLNFEVFPLKSVSWCQPVLAG